MLEIFDMEEVAKAEICSNFKLFVSTATNRSGTVLIRFRGLRISVKNAVML